MNSRKLIEYFLLILTLSSLAFLAIYVHGVLLFNTQPLPEVLFWIFTVTYSASIMLLWTLNGHRTILVVVIVSAFVMVILPSLRFYFYGADLVGEYYVADATTDLGRWTPERVTANYVRLDWNFQKPNEIIHRYFSTTSDTILPAMISEVTSLPVRLVLGILLSIVSTMVVIVGFLIVRKCFDQKIATLSSIVFIFSSFYMGKFPNILHEDIAFLFLFLVTFCILKWEKKNLVLSLVFLTLLPMSHYGLVYFAILLLLLLVISQKVCENRILMKILRKFGGNISDDSAEHIVVSKNLLLYSIVAGLSWLIFIAYPIFVASSAGFLVSLKTLLGLETSTLSYMQSHVVFSSLGPFHTIIRWFEIIMAIIGFILALTLCKSRKAFSLVFAGAGLLATALALAFLPSLSMQFDLDRTMQIALLGFSFFIATTLAFLSRKKSGIILSIFFVTLILLENLHSAPILYSSPANLNQSEYIFSFTHVITFYTFSDFQFAKWVESFTNKSAVFASDNIGNGLCLIAKRICVEPRGVNVSDTVSLLESGKTDYFLAVLYVPDYMSFTSESHSELQLNSTEIAKLLGSHALDRIYDNARVLTFDCVS